MGIVSDDTVEDTEEGKSELRDDAKLLSDEISTVAEVETIDDLDGTPKDARETDFKLEVVT
jgi:hypothetical protein